MRRLLVAGAVGLALAAIAPAAAAAAPAPAAGHVDLADLLADPAAYAPPATGAIEVRGELVGDFGRRGDAVWAQLNDDPYVDDPILGGGELAGGNVGIGVRIPAELWPHAGEPGGYRRRGPIVELAGVWRYHDPDRGGESYLDVTGLAVVAPPASLEEDVDWVPLGAGLVLVGIAAAIGIRQLRVRGLRPGR